MREKVLKLFKLTDATAFFSRFVGMMLDTFVTAIGKDDPEFAERVVEEYKKVVDAKIDSVTQKMVELYERTYNESEIDAMIAWHLSPTGQKIRAVSASVEADSMKIGEQFATECNAAMEPIVKKIEAELDDGA